MLSNTQTPVTATVPQVKEGKKTSTFLITLVGILVTSLPGLIEYLIAFAERNADKIPANSWLSFALPVLIAVGYQVTRYLTTNGERQAQAKVAEAQAVAAVATAKVPTAQDILKDAGKDLLSELVQRELAKRGILGAGVLAAGTVRSLHPQFISGISHASQQPAKALEDDLSPDFFEPANDGAPVEDTSADIAPEFLGTAVKE